MFFSFSSPPKKLLIFVAHTMCADCSLCGLHAIDVMALSYPSPSLTCPLPPVKGVFQYTLYSQTVKEKIAL
jgi:hypothetical protein